MMRQCKTCDCFGENMFLTFYQYLRYYSCRFPRRDKTFEANYQCNLIVIPFWSTAQIATVHIQQQGY